MMPLLFTAVQDHDVCVMTINKMIQRNLFQT